MSRESVELAGRFAEGVNARQFPADLFAPDLRIENVVTAVSDDVYYGREGAERWMRDLFEAFDADAHFEHEVITAADDHVVGRLRIVGRGSRSGAPLDLRWIGVLWTHEGRIVRAAGYASPHEALEAVGMRE